MKYAALKRNMILLLIAGIILAVGLFTFATYFMPLISFVYSLFGFIIVLAVIFYPIAIVYGWIQIKDVFYMMSRGMRAPFIIKGQSSFNQVKVILNYIIAFSVIVLLGWAYGLYFAWQRLQYSKRFSS